MSPVTSINADPSAPVRVRITEAQALAIINALPPSPRVAHPADFEPTLAEAVDVTPNEIEHALRGPGHVGLSRLLAADGFTAALTAKARGVGLSIRWSDHDHAWFLSVPPAPARPLALRRAA